MNKRKGGTFSPAAFAAETLYQIRAGDKVILPQTIILPGREGIKAGTSRSLTIKRFVTKRQNLPLNRHHDLLGIVFEELGSIEYFGDKSTPLRLSGKMSSSLDLFFKDRAINPETRTIESAILPRDL